MLWKNIHILTLEDRVTLYVHFHQKISSGTSVHARLSFLTDPDALTVIDTGGIVTAIFLRLLV